MKIRRILAILSLLLFCCHAFAIDLKGTIFEQVGEEKSIDPILLYSVALAESAYSPNTKVSGASPYPWTLRSHGEAFYGSSKGEAKRKLESFLRYTHSVDIGLMQVNLRWHKHRVSKPEDLLDPLTNVRVGADILLECISKTPNDLISGIGSYHSSHPQRRIVYGLTVFHIYNSLKQNAGQHKL